MHDDRQELLSSANRRLRRARRSTGRLLASALGFGVAYYFDVENGAVRRKRLHQSFQRAVEHIDAALASEAGGPPPVLVSMRRVLRPEDQGPAPAPAPPLDPLPHAQRAATG